MANFIRSAKFGSNWSDNELCAFNIRVVEASITAFFNTSELPPTSVSQVILNNVDMPDGPLESYDRLFFDYMQMVIKKWLGSHLNDFAAFILRMLHYEDVGNWAICQKMKFSFPMARQRVYAEAGVCLTNEPDALLVVREARSNKDPEPQVIAAAIAAFYQSNFKRSESGLQLLESKYITAITMTGTAPIFYRIPVTTSLLQAVATASYPTEETIVLKFIPAVPNPELYMFDGMQPLENRHIILQCFEAFKAVIDSD